MAQRVGVREISRRLGRSASTISRELRRNASTGSTTVVYRATTAQWHAERRARGPNVSRLAAMRVPRARTQARGKKFVGAEVMLSERPAEDGPALTGHGAEAVHDAITASITALPEQLPARPPGTQGTEMAEHGTDLSRHGPDEPRRRRACTRQPPARDARLAHTR